MSDLKHFSLASEDFFLEVRTKAEGEYTYRNRIIYVNFDEAYEDFLRRIKEYPSDEHELVVIGKESRSMLSLTVVICNSCKIRGEVTIDLKAIKSELPE